jgi:hypothetical protein
MENNIILALIYGETDYQSGGEARGEDDLAVLRFEFNFGSFSYIFDLCPWREDRSSDLIETLRGLNCPGALLELIENDIEKISFQAGIIQLQGSYMMQSIILNWIRADLGILIKNNIKNKQQLSMLSDFYNF